MKLRSAPRTIHEDPDNVGYWFQKNVSQTNTRERIHEDPDQPGYWFANN